MARQERRKIIIWYRPDDDGLYWCNADEQLDEMLTDSYYVGMYIQLTDSPVTDIDSRYFKIDQAGNLIRKSTKKIIVPADIVTAKIIAHKLRYG